MPDPNNWLHNILLQQIGNSGAAADATAVTPDKFRGVSSGASTSAPATAAQKRQLLRAQGAKGIASLASGLARSSFESGANVRRNLNKGLSRLFDGDVRGSALPLGLAIGETALNLTGGEGAAEKALAKKVAKRVPREVAAAIKMPDEQIFVGLNHPSAVFQAHDRYGKSVHDLLQDAKHGFVDMKGNFIPTEEFAAMKGVKHIGSEHLPITSDHVARARAAVEESNAIPAQAQKLFDAIKGKSGFSVDPLTGEHVTSGFAVGAGNEFGSLLHMPVDKLTPDVIADYLRKNKLPKNTILGGWVDDGYVFIEPSTLVKDRAKAYALGRKRGEKAIGDLAKYAAGEDGTIPVAFNEAQHNVPRLLSNNKGTQQKIADVEDMAYKTYTSRPFLKYTMEGQKMKDGGRWYPLIDNSIRQRAMDALGDEGSSAFDELMGLMASSTARSRPNNNLRRASWWRAMKLAGLLDPAELKTTTLIGPEGMGHIAQRAHHLGVASYLENGGVNSIANPKPGGFFQNLIGNHMPYTNDTVMANLTAELNPELGSLGFSRSVDPKTGLVNFSPRDWAYAPMERAAQRAAEHLHGRGLLDVAADYHPTATMQENAWIGRQGSFDGGMERIYDDLINQTAKMWGVSPVKANELMWRGRPLETSLTDALIRGRKIVK